VRRLYQYLTHLEMARRPRGVVTALTPAILPKAILAPAGCNKDLLSEIEALRNEGLVVIQALPNTTSNAIELNCDSQLVLRDGKWLVENLQS